MWHVYTYFGDKNVLFCMCTVWVLKVRALRIGRIETISTFKSTHILIYTLVSWWPTSIIPDSTKSIILYTWQYAHEYIQWNLSNKNPSEIRIQFCTLHIITTCRSQYYIICHVQYTSEAFLTTDYRYRWDFPRFCDLTELSITDFDNIPSGKGRQCNQCKGHDQEGSNCPLDHKNKPISHLTNILVFLSNFLSPSPTKHFPLVT